MQKKYGNCHIFVFQIIKQGEQTVQLTPTYTYQEIDQEVTKSLIRIRIIARYLSVLSDAMLIAPSIVATAALDLAI